MKVLKIINSVIKIVPMSVLLNTMFVEPQISVGIMQLFLFSIFYIGVVGLVSLIKELIK